MDYLSTLKSIDSRNADLDFASNFLLEQSQNLQTSELADYTSQLNDQVTSIGTTYTSAIDKITSKESDAIARTQGVISALEGAGVAVQGLKKAPSVVSKLTGYFTGKEDIVKKATDVVKKATDITKKAVEDITSTAGKQAETRPSLQSIRTARSKALVPKPAEPADPVAPVATETKPSLESIRSARLKAIAPKPAEPIAPKPAEPVAPQARGLKTSYTESTNYLKSKDSTAGVAEEKEGETFDSAELNQFDIPDTAINEPLGVGESVSLTSRPAMNEVILPKLPSVRATDVELATRSSNVPPVPSQISTATTKIRTIDAPQSTGSLFSDTEAISTQTKSIGAKTGSIFEDEVGKTLGKTAVEAGEAEAVGGGLLDPVADVIAGGLLLGGIVETGMELFSSKKTQKEAEKKEDDAFQAKVDAENLAKQSATKEQENLNANYNNIKNSLSSNTHAGVSIGVQSVRNTYRSSGTF